MSLKFSVRNDSECTGKTTKHIYFHVFVVLFAFVFKSLESLAESSQSCVQASSDGAVKKTSLDKLLRSVCHMAK